MGNSVDRYPSRSGMRRRAAAALGRQQGAISVMAVMLIATVAIGALVSIDVGYVFYSQRQLQKMADLAALSGAQQLKRADDLPTTTINVMASVTAAASQNGYPGGVSANCSDAAAGGADGMRACLGLWDPANAANGDSVRHFNAAYDTAVVSPNAVRVQATLTVPMLFVLPGGQSRQLHAEAIAAGSPPVASFSLGSGLADVNSANGILSLLLGNSVSLSVADWSGLVAASVTLEQLRLRAGVGTIDQLLNTTLSIQDFYALVLGAAGQQALLGAALGSPATQLGLNGIGTRLTLAQLLDLGVLTPAASSAAEVGLNVASLLTTAAYVARGTSAVDLSSLNVQIPGIGKVVGSMYVIEPPRVAVGPAKQYADGTWKTSATTAQVNLKLTAQVRLPVTGVATIDLNLPLWIRLAQAKGDLTNLQCAASSAQRRATINTATGVLGTCLGNPDSSVTGCATNAVTVANVAVLPIGLFSAVNAKVIGQPTSQNGAAISGTDVVLAPGGTATTSSSSPLGNTVTGLLNGLNPTLDIDVLGFDLLNITPRYLLSLLLDPLTQLLDLLVTRLSTLLGLNLATADLRLNSIDCNNAELVY